MTLPGTYHLMDGVLSLTGNVPLTHRFSSTSNFSGGIFRVAQSGTLRHLGLSIRATSGTIPAMAIRLETVSTDGFATNTLKGTNAQATFTPPATTAGAGQFLWYQMVADVAVTAGDLVAVMVRSPSGSYSGSNYVDVNYGVDSGNKVLAPYSVMFNSSKLRAWPMVAAKYADGTILRGSMPLADLNGPGFSSSGTNEYGIAFTSPFTGVCTGLRFEALVTTANTALTGNLYAGDATTPLATGDWNSTNTNVSGINFNHVFFTTPVAVTAGSAYRASLRCTAGSVSTLLRYDWSATADRDAIMGPIGSATRSTGAWSATTATQTYLISPIFESIETGGGSTGGVSRARVFGGF